MDRKSRKMIATKLHTFGCSTHLITDVDGVCNLLSEPVEYEDFEGDEDTVDLRANHVVGGLLHFNLLQMPPQPKVVKGWTITQCMLLLT